MATQYGEIYGLFLSKVSDYSFLTLNQATLETQLEGFLLSALPKFRFCKSDLAARDSTAKTFTATLSDSEKEIIVTLMLVEYMKPKIVTSELLKQNMSDRDFKLYSQANHLKELLSLYKEFKTEATKMITEYTFIFGDLEDLK